MLIRMRRIRMLIKMRRIRMLIKMRRIKMLIKMRNEDKDNAEVKCVDEDEV